MTTRLLSFDLAAERFAIDLGLVRAVVAVTEIQRIPDTPPFLLGLVASPLGPVPLVDFATKFHLGSSTSTGNETAIVVEALVDEAPSFMGLLVGDTCRVVEVEHEKIEPPPPLGAGIRAEYLRGVVLVDERILPIIDPGLALTATESEAIEGLQREVAGVVPDAGPERSSAGRSDSSGEDDELRAVGEELLVFTVSGERAALPLRRLREVVQHRPPTPVPGASEWIRGAINVRGEVIALLDVAKPLGLPSMVASSRSFHLILEGASGGGGGSVALAVDEIVDVTSHPVIEITESSVGLRVPAQYVGGIVRVRESFVPVLNTAALVAGAKARVADANLGTGPRLRGRGPEAPEAR